jgi:hypothetical protein
MAVPTVATIRCFLPAYPHPDISYNFLSHPCSACATMKVLAVFLASFGVLASLTLTAEAFMVRPPHASSHVLDSTTRSRCECRASQLDAAATASDQSPGVDPTRETTDLAPRRRQFLVNSIQKVAVVMGAAYAFSSVGTASAADVFEDLAMPTEEEQKQLQEVSTIFLFVVCVVCCDLRYIHLSRRRPTFPLCELSTRFWIRSSRRGA